MSRSKYWYQPEYWPPGGLSQRGERVFSSVISDWPSLAAISLLTMFVWAASMMAAPG
jgi:hypothetical protein